VLIVPKSSPINTAKELVAGPRPSQAPDVFVRRQRHDATVPAVQRNGRHQRRHIPYKSGGQALQDLIGGQVSTTFTAVATALPHVKAGTVKALGVSGLVRSPSMPDVPTIAEAALPGYELVSWSGALVRAGTPTTWSPG
jgi:tripartite-type tricarboxylate transporter receptor subunit TctC